MCSKKFRNDVKCKKCPNNWGLINLFKQQKDLTVHEEYKGQLSLMYKMITCFAVSFLDAGPGDCQMTPELHD